MKEINTIATSGILFDGRYKLLRPLSSDGGTADVWLALDTNTIDEVFDDEADNITALEETGIKVAIKIYRPKNALDLGEQRFREEFKIVFNCHHTNLIQPINFSIYEGIPYLVLPYCKNGSSSESLQGKIIDKDEIWRYISDVSAGLNYLHSFTPTIVHHDIKPANILIDDNDNYAITDFGISSHRGLNKDGYDESQSGTMAYMAPERFKGDYESIPESDIWSFGAALYELITGHVPFGEYGGQHQLETGSSIPLITQTIPNDIKNLIYNCLSADISKRPSAEYIYNCSLRKEYPIRKKKWYYFGGVALLISIIIIVLLSVLKGGNNDKPLPRLSNDKVYEQAMVFMNSLDVADLNRGLEILDSLGNLGYVPALYQQAFTYGWYSDSASVTRKNILGIEYNTKNGSNERWLPKSQSVNSKAIGLLTRIEELNDSAYPEINANALYRLAVYYLNDNNIFKTDISRAETLLINAREWAKLGNDSIIRRRIDNGLDELNLIKD